MTKIRASVLALGAILLVLISIVGTYFVLLATGSINSEGINLEITIKDEEKIYDGEALYAKEYEITNGSLLKDHSIQITYTGSQTDVGYSKSDADIKIVNQDNYNVTKEYNIKVNSGNLTVKRRDITVKANDESITYTGTTYKGTSFTVTSGSLVIGHQGIPTFKTVEIDEETNTGVSELQLSIFDSYGSDVTNNYNITYQSGTVTLDKIALNVRTLSLSKEYDGLPFNESEFKYELVNSTLPNGYTVEVDYVDNGVTNVDDESILTINKVNVYNAKGEDITKYYQITPINTGILSITPHEIKITLSQDNNTKEYDGAEFYNTKYTIEGESDSDSFTYKDSKYFLTLENYTKVIDTGSVENKLTFSIQNEYEEDATANFNIVQTTSILSITKKQLVVQGEDIKVTYNSDSEVLEEEIKTKLNDLEGTNGFTIDDTEYVTGLIKGHIVRLTYIEPSIESSKNEYTLAFTIKVYDNENAAIEDANDVTNNYNASLVFNTLRLSDLYTIEFANNESKTYDGKSILDSVTCTITDNAGITVSDSLAKEILSNITLKDSNTNQIITDPTREGTYTLTAILSNDNVDYAIEANTFTYKINRLDITVKGEEYSVAFNNNPQTYQPLITYNKVTDTKVCNNLPTGYYLSITYDSTNCYKTEVGEYDIGIILVKVCNEYGTDVSENFNITTYPGTFIITPISIDVIIYNQSFDYNDKDNYENIKYEISDTSVNITFVESGKTTEAVLKDAGSYLISAKLKTENENYTLNVTKGLITINKANLVVNSVTKSATYTGDSININSEFSSNDITSIGNIEGHTVTPTFETTTGTDVGTYNVAYIVTVTSGSTDVTDNYNITINPATFIINKKDLSVVGATKSATYIGDSIDINSEFNANDITTTGNIAGHTITPTFKTTTGTDVGTYNVAYTVTVTSGITNVTDNYNISITPATFIINKANLTITGLSETHEYDGESISLDNNSYKVEGLLGSDTCDVTIADVDLINVGSYQVGYEAIDTGNDNYNIITSPINVTIIPKTITVSLPTEVHTYSGSEITYDSDAAYSSLVTGETIDVTHEVVSKTNVGTYNVGYKSIKIKRSTDDVTSNYNIITTPGSLVINPANLIITGKVQNSIYKGTANSYSQTTADYTGLKKGTLTVTYNKVEETNVGTYNVPFTVTLTNEEISNYNVITTPGTLIIEKAKVTITFNNLSKVYDGNAITISSSSYTYSISSGTFNASNISITAPTTMKNAGTYSIVVTSNIYDLTVINSTVTISKLTVFISTDSVVSDDPIVAGSYTCSSSLFESEITIDTSYLDTVGTISNNVTLTPKSGYTLSNYDITLSLGTLTKTA